MFRGSSTQLYVPAFAQKDFHYIIHTGLPTQGTSTEDLSNTTLEYTIPLSNNTTSTQEAMHNNYHLYTQRDVHLAKTRSTSHQRDKAQSQHSNNHLYTQRDTNQTKLLHNHLYTRGITQSKENVITFGDHKDHKQLFPTKTRSYRQDDIIVQV